MNPSAKPRIAVVFGGRSQEHAVSCATAASVLAAIDLDSYDVVPIGISRDGRWVLESGDPDRLALTADHIPQVDGAASAVLVSNDPTRRELIVAEPGKPPAVLGSVDVVFPLLHGPWGEDGTIQGMLEMAGIRYVGSGVLASAVGMDKHYMKVVLAAAGLPVSPYVVRSAHRGEADDDAFTAAVERLGYPVFVKPARGGSSLGITKVTGPAGLSAAVEAAREFDPKVLVEAGAVGARELECAVLERLEGGADASVVAEITGYGDHEFYDFAAKYLGEDGVTLEVPAALEPQHVREVQRLSLAAFEALGCEGLARVDFFLGADGRLVVNEINTMPGFTPSSMYPRMWAESGVGYRALVDRLITLAANRPTGLR
ncbi:MAG TPA: D-alanine--D-alanine ligase family protein [Nocardioidaceae bacterium]|nr:D-alanine--D-alanine ligase family protein [Nocardioidaceae bacterium]